MVDSQNSTLDEFLEGKARLAFVVEWTRHFRIKVSVCRHGRFFFFFAVQALGIGVKVPDGQGFKLQALKMMLPIIAGLFVMIWKSMPRAGRMLGRALGHFIFSLIGLKRSLLTTALKAPPRMGAQELVIVRQLRHLAVIS